MANTTYWCKERLVITVEGPDGRRVVEVDRPFARVGSHEASEVVLTGEAIAPRQLYFHATPRGIFCVDLAPVKSNVPPLDRWTHTDEYFIVGPYQVSAHLGGNAAPPAEGLPDLNAKGKIPLPAPVLELSANGESIAQRELTRQLTVFGRRRPSVLRVTSHSVSASHCVFYWDSNVLWVVDLLSGNGTRLDGHPIEAGRLGSGETVRAGRVDLSLLAPREVDRGDDGVREITYDDGPAEERIGTDNDDSLDADRVTTDGGRDEFPREIAESLALAARLASQREDFDAERAAWDERRGKTEAELAQRDRELAARLASQREDFDVERVAWNERRWKTEAELAQRDRELAQHDRELAQRDRELAAQLVSQREDFDAERAAWNERRWKTEAELAQRDRELAAQQAEFDRRMENGELQRQATRPTVRLGPQWSPPTRSAGVRIKRPWYTALGRWVAVATLALIVSASIGSVCWFALLPAQTVVAAVRTTAEPAPSLESSGFLDENEDALRHVTLQEILQTPRMTAAVLLRPDVRSLRTIESHADAFEWLQKELVVEPPDGDRLTRISLRGRNAEELKILLDVIAEECVSEAANLQCERLERCDKALEACRNRHERDIASKQAALDQLAGEVSLENDESLSRKRQANLKQLNEAEGKLASLRANRTAGQIEVAANRVASDGAEKVDVSSIELNSRLRTDPVAGPLRAELTKLVRARSEVAATATGPVAERCEKGYQQKIEATAKKLVARRAKLRTELLAQQQNRTGAEKTENPNSIDGRPTRERELQEEINERTQEDQRFHRIEDLDRTLVSLRESLATATREQEGIQARLVSRAAECVVQHAATVQPADRTYRLPISVVAAACGFFAPLLYAAAWSSRKRRARSVTRLLKENA